MSRTTVADDQGQRTRRARLANMRQELLAPVTAIVGYGEMLREAAARDGLDEMVPAPGQAALAVEATTGSPAAALTDAIDDPSTRQAVEAERAVLAMTNAGCRSALGVYGEVVGDVIDLTGFVADERGLRSGFVGAADPKSAAGLLVKALEL